MEESGRFEYKLCRKGSSATVIGVRDVLKLNSDVTRFGRHSVNDHYLDSSKYPQFISRWHAEIHCVQQDNCTKYILRDNSLNGTYVNDYRVQGNYVLNENDIINFGHRKGKTVKPGEYAPQDHSEFKFAFEKAKVVNRPQSKPITSEAITPLPKLTNTGLSEDALSPEIPKAGKRQLYTPEVRTATDAKQTAVPRRILSENSVILKDISNSTNSNNVPGLLNLDHLVNDRSAQSSSSTEEEDDLFRLAANAVSKFGADSDSDIFDVDIVTPGKNKSNTLPIGKVLESPESDDKSSTASPLITVPMIQAPRMNLNCTVSVRPLSQEDKRGKSPSTMIETKIGKLGTISKQDNLNTNKHKIKRTETLEYPIEVGDLKNERCSRRKVKKVMKQGVDTTSRRSLRSQDKHEKETKRKTGNKRKRKGKTLPPNKKQHSSEDDDYNYHLVDEECSAYDCSKPTSQKVTWVQCDSCDKWYHTSCVGCEVDSQTLSKAQFTCGC